MTDEELGAIKARMAAATEGPWESVAGWVGEELAVRVRAPNHRVNGLPWLVCKYPIPPDAEFITHARDDIPALVAEVERLQHALHDKTPAS